jgi:hypothetical protein
VVARTRRRRAAYPGRSLRRDLRCGRRAGGCACALSLYSVSRYSAYSLAGEEGGGIPLWLSDEM